MPSLETTNLEDGEIVGFIRMGNDNNQNFYQIELPLRVTLMESHQIQILSGPIAWS